MNMIKSSVLLFCSYFLLYSCSGPAPASKITAISEVKAEIEIYQSLTNKNDNIVTVILYDKKNKEIGNESINIWVNQKATDYQIMQNLYYTKKHYYRIEHVQPENGQYDLQIQLANGKKFFLGNASTLTTSSPNNIIYNKEASLNQDFSIQWSNLYDVNRLCISKSVEIENKENTNIHSFIEGPTDTIRINADGNYQIAWEKLLFNPKEKLSTMSFTFIAQKKGTLNPLLLKGSSIKIWGEHQKRTSFK